MAGRPAKVGHIRDTFIGSLTSARKLYDAVLPLGKIHPKSEKDGLHTEHVGRVVELAFLGVVSTWEEFLEQTLVRYLCGAKSDTGYCPQLRLGECSTISHAYQILSNDPNHDPSKHYLSLSKPKDLADLAKLYFKDGKPFSELVASACQQLNDATLIRNRVAHTSEKCREDFKKVARRFRGLADGAKLPQGYRAGDLLCEHAVRCFGNRARDKNWTFFVAYLDMYETLAKKIVP